LYNIIIGKDTISFMQGIYTYIIKTNHVPKQHNVTAILSLLFMVPISLAPALALMHFYISTFRSVCAVPNMTVFCSSLTSIIIIIIIITISNYSAVGIYTYIWHIYTYGINIYIYIFIYLFI
jgi:hypothetical protein